MQILKDIASNHVLIAAVAAWLITQFLMLIIHLIVEKRFAFERLLGDGGMPSVHSATVSSLATACGLVHGFGTPLFAVAAIFAIVVMRDAMGVRYETGKQAVSIKQLAEVINASLFNKSKEIRTENLKVLVGHSPIQVFFGGLCGIAIALIYCFIFVF